MSDAGTILRAEALGIAFGGLRALSDVSLHLDEGEILCIIGPNGSGKTTLFNCLSGVYTHGAGSVLLRKRGGGAMTDISRESMFHRSRQGLARTFQTLRLFESMSVLDNVLCGFFHSQKVSPATALWGGSRLLEEERSHREQAKELLSFLSGDLLGQQDIQAGSLAYADRRRLEIARALATNPTVLLLDEPAAGMSHPEAEALARDIFAIRDRGISLIVIEHNMGFIKQLGGRVMVLGQGSVLAQGHFEDVCANPAVISAYLGEPADA